MCGRIALYEDPDRIARLVHAGINPELSADWRPMWNLGPQARLLGVSERHGERFLDVYRWGLVPYWAKDPAAIKSTFNARAETVATKPMFRTAFKSHRILVPADAFYEWKTLGPNVKQPYAFTRSDGEPIMFAGLREWWKDAEGHELRTATIITTHAGPDMRSIHNRQPVVLDPQSWDRWLDPAVTDPKVLEPLLVPTAEGTLVHHPVSKDVGNVRNNTPDLLEAVPLEEDGER